jgi:hypothetical protein
MICLMLFPRAKDSYLTDLLEWEEGIIKSKRTESIKLSKMKKRNCSKRRKPSKDNNFSKIKLRGTKKRRKLCRPRKFKSTRKPLKSKSKMRKRSKILKKHIMINYRKILKGIGFHRLLKTN